MAMVARSDLDSFEDVSENIGFVASIEDWAKRNGHNVYIAVEEHKEIKEPIVFEIRR